MANIEAIGTSEQIQANIASELSINKTDAEKIFNYLKATYQDKTEEFGSVSLGFSSGENLTFGEGFYYINLPKGILLTIALFLDITLTQGIISGICGLAGIDTKVFYKMNQKNGEVCVLREYMRGKYTLDANQCLHFIGKECINNDLECRHRDSENKCRLTKENIEKILLYFREAGIAK